MSIIDNIKKYGIGHSVGVEKKRAELESYRSSYLYRAQEYSKLTLPHIIPVQGSYSSAVQTDRGEDANQHGFDSIGAEVNNNLANKLAITLFPPQSSFFRMKLSPDLEAQLGADGYRVSELSQAMAVGETRAMDVFSDRGCRSAMVELMKHLQIAGNACLFLDPDEDNPVQIIPMSRYYVYRDKSGFILDYMQEDFKAFSTLDESVQDILRGVKEYNDKDNVKVLTYAHWHGGQYHIVQCADDILVDDVKKVDKEDLPWVPLVWNLSYGEHYGRGLTEDCSGDFYVLSFLNEARAKGAALMADIKYLIRPGSTVDIDELIESPSGEYIYGDINDIGVLQLERYADFTTITAIIADYEKRIGRAFLMGSSQRRNAERVTAYEIRLDAQELETSLGGVYSRLSDSLQVPLARFLFKEIDFPLEGLDISPSIITGLEALGRIGDMEKIAQFSEMMQIPATWPEPVQQRIKWSDYTDSVLASLSLEAPWLMTEEELANQQQQQRESQQQDMMDAEMAKASGTAATGLIERQMLGEV